MAAAQNWPAASRQKLRQGCGLWYELWCTRAFHSSRNSASHSFDDFQGLTTTVIQTNNGSKDADECRVSVLG